MHGSLRDRSANCHGTINTSLRRDASRGNTYVQLTKYSQWPSTQSSRYAGFADHGNNVRERELLVTKRPPCLPNPNVPAAGSQTIERTRGTPVTNCCRMKTVRTSVNMLVSYAGGVSLGPLALYRDDSAHLVNFDDVASYKNSR